jgi:hypothetical protein
MTFDISRQILEKSLNINFHERPSSGIRVSPSGQTNVMKLTVAFWNFANMPKNIKKKNTRKMNLVQFSYKQKRVSLRKSICDKK